MCVPIAALGLTTAMQTVMAATALASTAVAVRSAQMQGQVAAQTARNNQIMAQYAAQDAIKRGDEAAAKAERQSRQVAGAQRAGMASKGLDLTEGTAAELQAQTDFFGSVDATTAKNNAAREAWTLRNQGAQAAAQGAAAQQQANLQATGALLNGASRVAGSWYTPTSQGFMGPPSNLAGP